MAAGYEDKMTLWLDEVVVINGLYFLLLHGEKLLELLVLKSEQTEKLAFIFNRSAFT